MHRPAPLQIFRVFAIGHYYKQRTWEVQKDAIQVSFSGSVDDHGLTAGTFDYQANSTHRKIRTDWDVTATGQQSAKDTRKSGWRPLRENPGKRRFGSSSSSIDSIGNRQRSCTKLAIA